MPVKRKLVKQGAAPGIARSFISETFSSLPMVSYDLKNGHVLYVYITSANKSRIETERFLKHNLPEVDGYKFKSSSPLNSNIKTLVNQTLGKFQNLGDSKELEMFSLLCSGRFHLQVDTPVEAVAQANPTASTCDSHMEAPPPTSKSGSSIASHDPCSSSLSTPILKIVSHHHALQEKL